GGEAAVPALADLLKDKDENIRFQAIQILRNMGPKTAAKAMPAVKEAVADSNPNVRGWAMYLIAQSGADGVEFLVKTYSGGKAGVPSLNDCLGDGNVNVRHSVCNLLANIGPDAAAALPALRKLADDGSNVNVQQAARNAVKRIDVKR